MRLYAALYAATTGTWPVKLELVPLHGDTGEIPFDTRDCEALLAEAVATFASINGTIAELATRHEDPEAHLATPSEASCRQCPFRPACAPYRQALRDATGKGEWPNDVWGKLLEMRQLGNGKLLLTVQTDPNGDLRHLRGITGNSDRHPALQHVREGHPLGIFSLRGTAGAGTLTETPWTVIYKLGSHRFATSDGANQELR